MEDEESDVNGTTQPPHDFINVHSFSQLPFTRPPLSKQKPPPILRLFGQDFTGAGGDNGGNYSGTDFQEQEQEQEQEDDDQSEDNSNKSSNNNRRFECHYCFRNFPTSQALGGHQNAHKRERQLAKRGVSSYLHQHSDNYRRYYTPWNNGTLPATSSRFYGGNLSGSGMSTINGNPLGVWRVPSSSATSASASATASTSVYNSSAAFTTHRNPSFNLAGTQQQVGGSAAQNQTTSYWYGLKPNAQDNVSLDLHL